MKNELSLLLSNKLINVGVISWAAAQLIKTMIDLLKHKSFNKKLLLGAGGMPSSHSSVSCSVLLAAYSLYGYESPIFALAFIQAFIVIYDATGVRWAAGLHARAINHIVKYLEDKDTENKVDLQELVPILNESLGHRVIEVICGAILGFAIAILYIILTSH